MANAVAGDGRIDFEEFVAGFTALLSCGVQEEVRR